MCRTSYSENLTALKKCLLWRGRFSQNIVVLKLLLHIQDEASSFEKKKIMSVILSYCLNICFLSQYFFLGVCFGKSALNSIDLFQVFAKVFSLKGPIYDVQDVAQKMCRLFRKNSIICLNYFRGNYLRSSSWKVTFETKLLSR